MGDIVVQGLYYCTAYLCDADEGGRKHNVARVVIAHSFWSGEDRAGLVEEDDAEEGA